MEKSLQIIRLIIIKITIPINISTPLMESMEMECMLTEMEKRCIPNCQTAMLKIIGTL